MGIQLGDNRQVYLYAPFKISNIIIGSPLSIRTVIGAEDEPTRNFDFLSSIEVMALYRADVFLMQNWDHLEEILKVTNKIPKRDSVTSDFNRIRDIYLEEKSENYRQHIIITEFNTPQIMSILSRSKNIHGNIRTVEKYSSNLAQNKLQRFYRFAVSELSELPDRRFEYFTQDYWSKVKEELPKNTIIFVSSYYEYVRLKSYFEENDPGVLCVSEYTPKPERQRAVAHVANGTNKALCVTERLMYFRNPKFKDVGRMVFYSLPENSSYYSTLAENAQEVIGIYSKFDGLALQRIVGDKNAARLLKSANDLFTFH
jgi:U3 small nucleolar RNA-associated protein 25